MNHRSDPPAIFVSTGSTSSDMLTAPLLRELIHRRAAGRITALGGQSLREAGAELLMDTTPLSSVGVASSCRSIVCHAATVIRAGRMVARLFRRHRPALVILVDNPGQNLRILSMAHHLGIPTLYYVPPEGWGLTRWQIGRIARQSTAIAALSPSEAQTYREYGGKVRCIGHPALDLLQSAPPVPHPHEPNGHPPTIGLFPGSRRDEVIDLLPVLREAARLIQLAQPDARFVLCSANDAAQKRILAHLPTWQVPVELVHRQSHAVLSRCDLLLTCSGTATLEAAIMGVPMVAMYRVHHLLDRLIRLALVRYSYFALPNYLLNRPIVPELCNRQVTGRRVAEEGLSLLHDVSRRRAMLEGLADVRKALGGGGAVMRAADLAHHLLEGAVVPEPPAWIGAEVAAGHV